MKCVSFNVNSIRTRLHQLEEVVDKYDPEFIGLQETKVTDDLFPHRDITSLGYHSEFIGQKTHYGVALLSKTPPTKVFKGFASDNDDSQKRFVGGNYTVGSAEISVLNGYFPQGESRDHPVKFPNKQKFYADLLTHLQTNHDANKPVIVMGDMNIAPLDIDIGIGEDNKKRWLRTGKTCFLPEEREWLERLSGWGLCDTYRKINTEQDKYSWFDYRSRGFEREPKRGLRIDLIMATKNLYEKCVDSGIDYDIRSMEQPSDHCPVWSDFEI